MTTPFYPVEIYPDGMAIQEVDFLSSPVPATPFRATRIVVQAGGSSPVDVHAATECWFAASGTATMRLGDDSLTLTQGDVVEIAPHIPHQAVNDTDSDFVFFSLWWNPTDPAKTR
jgi:mannose-6-phosphate isomerase-like protein (cupin superfamily)